MNAKTTLFQMRPISMAPCHQLLVLTSGVAYVVYRPGKLWNPLLSHSSLFGPRDDYFELNRRLRGYFIYIVYIFQVSILYIYIIRIKELSLIGM